MVPPIPAPVQVLVGVVTVPQPTANLNERKVINRVLDGATHGPAERGRNVPILQPVGQGAAPFGRRARRVARVVVVGRRHLGVGHHGLVAVLPVDLAADALDVGVGQDVVAVGAPLRGAVPEGGAGVGHEAYVSPDVDQGADVLLVGVGLDDVEEGCAASELSQMGKTSKYMRVVLGRLERLTRSHRVKMSS